jgi:hypothetical protein
MDTKPSPEESGKRVKPRMNFNRDKVAAQGYGNGSEAPEASRLVCKGHAGRK